MTRVLMDLMANAEAAAAELNKAVLSDSHKAIGVANEKLSKAVSAYNERAQEEEFEVILSYDDPLLEAITRLTIPCIKAQTKSDKDTGVSHTTIEDDKAIINLIALEAKSPKRLFPNGQWRWELEAFTYRMAAKANKEIGGDAKLFANTYKMGVSAKELAAGVVPTSNKQVTAQLQKIVDGAYFVDNGSGLNKFKVLNEDVNYILYLMCGHGKKFLSVRMPRASTMQALVTEVLHRLVCGGKYSAEYEAYKDGEKPAEKKPAAPDAEDTPAAPEVTPSAPEEIGAELAK